MPSTSYGNEVEVQLSRGSQTVWSVFERYRIPLCGSHIARDKNTRMGQLKMRLVRDWASTWSQLDSQQRHKSPWEAVCMTRLIRNPENDDLSTSLWSAQLIANDRIDSCIRIELLSRLSEMANLPVPGEGTFPCEMNSRSICTMQRSITGRRKPK